MVFVVCALLALVAIVYVVYVQPGTTPVPAPDPQLGYLLEKKAVLYENLRDLNLEYRMGKLSDDDYQRLKKQCQFEIGGVMAQIESHQGSASARAAEPPVASPPSTREPRSHRGEQICPFCGAGNSWQNKFCGECGEKLAEVAQESKQ